MTNEVNSYTKETFTNKSAEEIFTIIAGGEKMRGAVSLTIRTLSSLDYTRGQIAKMLGKRYQHVKNVLDEPLKK